MNKAQREGLDGTWAVREPEDGIEGQQGWGDTWGAVYVTNRKTGDRCLAGGLG